MSSAQINMCYIIYFVFIYIILCSMMLFLCIPYTCSIVLRVQNKGNDDDDQSIINIIIYNVNI